MKKYNVKKLVFSSSATVYGMTEQVPINEEVLLRSNESIWSHKADDRGDLT